MVDGTISPDFHSWPRKCITLCIDGDSYPQFQGYDTF
jgi:hypothetical protein